MLNTLDSLVLIIDIQEKLTNMLDDEIREQMIINSQKLVAAAKALNVDTIVTEQYPKGLGQTIEGIRDILDQNYVPFEKTAFNALLEDGFASKIKSHNKKQVVILLDELSASNKIKIIDFLSGACYALKCDMKKVDDNKYILN